MRRSPVRNVLFILADQWRGDSLSACGHPWARTPTLDALAADGALFRRHYAQAVPCGPSRASILTGLYLHNHRAVANGTPLDARHTNLAREARRTGVAPVLFGYTDTATDPRGLPAGDPDLSSYEGVMPGFEPVARMRDDRPNAWHAWLHALGYDVPTPAADIWRPVSDEPGAPARYRAEHSDTAFLTGAALDWLAVNGDRPWFVHLSYLRPHPPFVAPEPYNRLIDPAAILEHGPAPVRGPSRAEEAAAHPLLAHLLDGAAGWRGDDRALAQLKATYYGLIHEVDHHIGRVIAHLKATGQYDRTLIVFGADHGEQLGDHWLIGKTGWFDQSFHVPLIVRDPDPAAVRGEVIDAFTEHVDLMPTMLDRLGLDVPRQCDGRALTPFLFGDRPADWRPAAHFEFDFRDAAARLGIGPDRCALAVIRDARGKYVHFADGLPPVFFDLSADPAELRNRAADPAAAPLLLDYAQRMLSWRLSTAERTLTHIRLGAG